MADAQKAVNEYDIIVAGAGIAGLWLGARLLAEGYNVIVADEGPIGGIQTLASQGMIHGGQKYTLTGKADPAATGIAAMPGRWEACFAGEGEIDLSSVAFTDDQQVMWPAGGESMIKNKVSEAAVFAAAQAVNAGTEKMDQSEWPPVLAKLSEKKKFGGPVYRLPEKVLDVKTLASALMKPLEGRIFRGRAEKPLPDGTVTIGGKPFRAQAVIFSSGKGNEEVFDYMKVETKHTQRRPLRMVMVKTVHEKLNGHGIIAHPKPRATVTSHPLAPDGSDKDGYVWYLGGGVAEKGPEITADESIAFAKAELSDMFPHIDWSTKEWATLDIDRAEPLSEDGRLPPGSYIHQRGQVLVAWPVKLTFAPMLSDQVLDWLKGREIAPRVPFTAPPLEQAELGAYPWETAEWISLKEAA